VLAHLVLADDLAGPNPDLGGAGEPAGCDGGGDDGQLLVGCLEQGEAFTGSFGGQGGVAAGDQPFAGVVGVGD
jgi:hypothetical protein